MEVRADPLLAEELNTFYGRFERNGGVTLPISASGSSRQSSNDHVFTVSEDDVRRELRRVNVRKAAGPDGITGRVLRSCADQLAGLFTSIFNESLATSVVPTPFKKSVIIPVPKNSKPSCLNDYRPVALTSTVMKVFERLLKKHICSSIPATLDPLQFAYRPNRSTDDAISQVLHSSLTHIDSKNGNYVRLLFIDYSSAFNTIVPTKLAVKLSDLGLNTSLCDWIQDFLFPAGHGQNTRRKSWAEPWQMPFPGLWGVIRGSPSNWPGHKAWPYKDRCSPFYANPADKHDVQRFLSMTNYSSKLIPGYSENTAPLRQLLVQDVEWNWQEHHMAVFTRLQELLTSPPVLQYFDVHQPVVLSADASQHGLGAVCLQNNKPVAFASRAITETESRYAQIEKELLALVYACHKFHDFIYGRPVTVETDHQPLIPSVGESYF